MTKSISKEKRLKILLSKGYLPSELPPAFNSISFSNFITKIFKDWDTIVKTHKSSALTVFSIPHLVRGRRILHIVNPVSQAYLTKLISDNWSEISRKLRSNSFSLDKAQIVSDGKRALKKPLISVTTDFKEQIAAEFDFGLKSDISRFYGTLYTHAIPWGLYTKEWCKANYIKNKPLFKSKFGDKLDAAVRKCQSDQTIGIPVGPDTSRIISEIIGVAIDKEVIKECKIITKNGSRFVDDFYFGIDNNSDGEKIISSLSKALRKFELEINNEKTEIIRSSKLPSTIWVKQLNKEMYSLKDKVTESKLQSFFSLVFHLSQSNPNENVLNYAVKQCRNLLIGPETYQTIERFLLRASRENSTTYMFAAHLLVKFNVNGLPVSKSKIAKLAYDMIKKHSHLGHTYEVAWSLFLLKLLKIELPNKLFRMVGELECSICAILLYDMKDKGLIIGSFQMKHLESFLNSEGLYTHMWMFSYEADRRNWIKNNKKSYVDDDPHFSVLKQNNISFYDESDDHFTETLNTLNNAKNPTKDNENNQNPINSKNEQDLLNVLSNWKGNFVEMSTYSYF